LFIYLLGIEQRRVSPSNCTRKNSTSVLSSLCEGDGIATHTADLQSGRVRKEMERDERSP